MRAFFNESTAHKKVRDLPGCGACKLCRTCNTPRMPPSGNFEKGVLVLAEAPGAVEDARGTQLVGKCGQLLRQYLDIIGVDLDRDCLKTNAVCCRPPDNETPDADIIGHCRPNVMRAIEEHKPKAILMLGGSAVTSLYGERTHTGAGMGISTWRGFLIPDQTLGCWTLATYHPSYIMRLQKDKERDFKVYESLFIRDLKRLFTASGKPVPDYAGEVAKGIRAELDERVVCAFLREANEAGNIITFDFETSGIKPDAKGHWIECCAVYSEKHGYAMSFLVSPQDGERTRAKQALVELLANPEVKKVNHNIKYEERWSRKCLGVRVAGWLWDTRLGAHCVDNRPGIYPLKFQSGIHFGVFDYDDALGAGFSDDEGKSSNAINNIRNVNRDALMEYNAKDAWFTYHLYLKQKKELGRWQQSLEGGDTFLQGLELFRKGLLTFADMEECGARIDTDRLAKMDTDLKRMIREARTEFEATGIYKKWRKVFGPKTDIGSGAQLRTLLYDKMGLKPHKVTERSEEGATDKDALLALDIPDLQKLLDMRLLEKARGTYIRQIQREVVDGILHTNINLHRVVTQRSSCDSPNLQNVPARNKRIKEIVRNLFPAIPGAVIGEGDLKGAEVSTAACYTQDKNLVRYVSDLSTDMHKDTAVRLFQVDRDLISSELRHVAKNRFVFPEFYGSYFVNCAQHMWLALRLDNIKLKDGSPVLEHLATQGIKTLAQFTELVESVENYFWNEMYGEYTEWKDRWYAGYVQRGYVDSYTGFRYWGPMNRNHVINYPIQGDAFHINLWACNALNHALRKRKMRSRLFLQIHDSILSYIFPEERDEYYQLYKDILTRRVRERWQWITVPIIVEVAESPIDGTWAEKKEIKI